MASSTPNYNLRKPAGSDNVNVTTDISNNMDLIDAALAQKASLSADQVLSGANDFTGGLSISGQTVATAASVVASGTANNPVTDASAARPTGLTVVYWMTSTQPTNLAAGDIWIVYP